MSSNDKNGDESPSIELVTEENEEKFESNPDAKFIADDDKELKKAEENLRKAIDKLPKK